MPDRRHLPAAGRPVPTSTYRVQLRPEFGFDAAAAVVDYLAELGVGCLYCSPVLTAAPGSVHGYDVVSHRELSAELGGAAGHDRLRSALRAADLGEVVDVVPNHMALPEPESLNRAWWDVLRSGRRSAYAGWFDIDWDSPANPGQVLVPVLGETVGTAVAKGELSVDSSGVERVLRYYDHAFPLAAGTDHLAGDLDALLDRQHYRLAFWRVAGEELNYRRFFDVTTLAGLRVEDPAVFTATSETLLGLVRDGAVDGLRIDHPDGLADPRGYLDRLAAATGGSWVVAEKILAAGEELPADWSCAGTTGYDALNQVLGVFLDPAGERPLSSLYGELTGEPTDYEAVVSAAKRHAVTEVLAAEVNRLVRLLLAICHSGPMRRDHTVRALREALVEVLTAFGVYRAYVEPGVTPTAAAVAEVEAAAGIAAGRLPGRAAEVELIRDLALGRGLADTTGSGREARAEFVVRFQQTTGPVLAKGVEDTAFYRYLRLTALNEVGGDPGRFGTSVAEFHAGCSARQAHWPVSMTTLSTHDTKRAEDVRARLAVLSELPTEWGEAVTGWRAAAAPHREHRRWPDRNAEYLFWQTLVGAWPLPVERALPYLEKATREAKQHTSWTDPNPAYDEALAGFVRRVLADGALLARVERFVTDRLLPPGRVTSLAQKLLQLTMPGVPDVYQGSELWDLSLVDPDNRRPVDYDERRRLLAGLSGAAVPAVDDSGAAKLLVTSRSLRLRREHPSWFGPQGDYEPLTAAGPAAGHVVAFSRAGAAVTVVPRLVVGLARRGGWGDTALLLPTGPWRDTLGGGSYDGGRVPVADLLSAFPVALLVRAG